MHINPNSHGLETMSMLGTLYFPTQVLNCTAEPYKYDPLSKRLDFPEMPSQGGHSLDCLAVFIRARGEDPADIQLNLKFNTTRNTIDVEAGKFLVILNSCGW